MLQRFELTYKWNRPDKLTSFQGPLFHGVLMHGLEQHYAEKIHHTNLAEFHLKIRPLAKQNLKLTIEALTKEASHYIGQYVKQNSQNIHLNKRNLDLTRIDSQVEKVKTYQQWLKECLSRSIPDYLLIQFHSPTSFKQQGQYVPEPDLYLIYLNLINRFNQLQADIQFDSYYYKDLSKLSRIEFSSLDELKFPLGRVSIPAFRGNMLLQLRGTEHEKMHQFLLWNFADRAGVGIKTAQGMGYITLQTLYKEN